MNYLPELYKVFRHRFGGIADTYDKLALECHQWGPLDAKTRRLVKLGVAIGLNSEGGVRSHARRALEEGITAEEILHVVLLSFTTSGFPTMSAALKWVEEVIEKHNVPAHSRR